MRKDNGERSHAEITDWICDECGAWHSDHKRNGPLNTIEVGTLGVMTAIWAGGCFATIAIGLLHNVWKVF